MTATALGGQSGQVRVRLAGQPADVDRAVVALTEAPHLVVTSVSREYPARRGPDVRRYAHVTLTRPAD